MSLCRTVQVGVAQYVFFEPDGGTPLPLVLIEAACVKRNGFKGGRMIDAK